MIASYLVHQSPETRACFPLLLPHIDWDLGRQGGLCCRHSGSERQGPCESAGNCYDSVLYNKQQSTGHVTLAAIAGTTILVPYLEVTSLQLIWRSDWPIRRQAIIWTNTDLNHYKSESTGDHLQRSCKNLTTWQSASIIGLVMDTEWHHPLCIYLV